MNILALVSVYLLIAVILTVFFAVYAIVRGKSKPAFVFSLMCILIAIYVFGYVMELNSPNLSGMQFWNQIQYVGLPFFPSLWLILSLQYAKKERYLKPLPVALTFAVPAFDFLVHLTNSSHHLFYTDFSLQTTG